MTRPHSTTRPDDWTAVIDADRVEEGTLVPAHVDEMPVLLVRQGERIHALDDRCSHRGCPLHDGSSTATPSRVPVTAARSVSTAPS